MQVRKDEASSGYTRYTDFGGKCVCENEEIRTFCVRSVICRCRMGPYSFRGIDVARYKETANGISVPLQNNDHVFIIRTMRNDIRTLSGLRGRPLSSRESRRAGSAGVMCDGKDTAIGPSVPRYSAVGVTAYLVARSCVYCGGSGVRSH